MTDPSAQTMTERLIQAAVDYEQAQGIYAAGARRELSEARAAIEAALRAAPAEVRLTGAMRAQWTYDPEVQAYYFAPMQASPPPYNTRHVEAIIDIANDGTLAGVELIENMPPPPVTRPMQAVTEKTDGSQS